MVTTLWCGSGLTATVLGLITPKFIGKSVIQSAMKTMTPNPNKPGKHCVPEWEAEGQGWECDLSVGLKEMTEVQWKLWGLAAQRGFTVSHSGNVKSPWSDSEHPVSAEKLPDQTAVSKWCWWELWWFSFPWCLLRDCTAQIMVPSITWAALGYKRQEANKIYRRSMPFWRGTWKSSGIIQCTRNGNRQHRAVLLRTNN